MPNNEVSHKYIQTIENESIKSVTWHGFNNFTIKNGLEMILSLLIPATIAILAIVLQKNDIDMGRKNRENDLHISQLQRDNDDQQSLYVANETVFNNYIKTMADVILYSSTKYDGEQYIATRALTSTVLRQIDIDRKKLVILFLYDSTILQRYKSIFHTPTTDDNERNLKNANLNNIDFSKDFNLSTIVLRDVSLINSTFSNSNLDQSDFSYSILNGANFSNTILDRTKFVNVDLQKSDFQNASTEFIQLINVNLNESTINNEQINKGLFIYNTILPNGTYSKNKTFIQNGDGKQYLNYWNITSGLIENNYFYFIGTNNSTMFQRINTNFLKYFKFYRSFHYCLSFFVHQQQYLYIQFIYLDQKQKILNINYINKIISFSCKKISSNSLEFCYWSYCNNSLAETQYIDLKFIFGYTNHTTNKVAIKDIEFTIYID